MEFRDYTVHCHTENYEEYVLRIVARTYEEAEEVAKMICDKLGVIFDTVFESEF